jgi:hypothetical protein
MLQKVALPGDLRVRDALRRYFFIILEAMVERYIGLCAEPSWEPLHISAK